MCVYLMERGVTAADILARAIWMPERSLCDSVVTLYISPPFFTLPTALFLSHSLSSHCQLTILPHLEQNQSILASPSVLLQPAQHLATTVCERCGKESCIILPGARIIFLKSVFTLISISPICSITRIKPVKGP